jgi:beta-lactamase superfamily II metal-dependent hydrolase
LLLLAAALGYVGYRFVYPWWKTKPPPASGGELQVYFLDVGPINGDSTLIICPNGQTVLVDAGDTSKGKVVLDALKKKNVTQIDYFIATHPHPDHIGGASEVIKSMKVVNVIDNGLAPIVPERLQPPKPAPNAKTKQPPPPPPGKKGKTKSITQFYDDYKDAVAKSGAHYTQAQPGIKFDLGSGVLLTILGPYEPMFTREQMKAGGNETNANSVVARIDYGEFSLLLPGDAEEQSEHRMTSKEVNLAAKVVKISHHGSKYATSDDFLKRVNPAVAVISVGEWNRYGQPAQAVLDRLKAANVKLYRTDQQGEIALTTRGKESDYVIKTSKTSTSDPWVGRLPEKDDSSRSGFIAYGDFGPPPKPRAEKKAAK